MKLGYEVQTGEVVELPLHHLLICGLTQLSGKTTTLEALISRSGVRAIAFRTKRGELGFSTANRLKPYFREQSEWQYTQSVLEAVMREKMKFERSWIIKVTKGTKSLRDVRENIRKALEKARGLSESVYTNLAAYLDIVIPQIEAHDFATSLKLKKGLNVMDLEDMSPEMQSLIIQSSMDYIMDKLRDTIVVVPEAWHFIPQRRSSPVKWAAERFIRQGAVLGNYLWLDSQDITGVEKSVLKSIDMWILGRQREINEVQRTLKQLPVPASLKPKPEEVMSLEVGHFYACFSNQVRKVYVEPVWLQHGDARAVALGAPIPGPPKTWDQGDEEMWKEKYEELRKTYEHDVAQQRRKILDLEKLAKDLEEANQRSAIEIEDLQPIKEFLFHLASAIGKTVQAPPQGSVSEEAHLRVEQEVPEMEVEQKVVHYNANDGDYRGRLGILIASGYFDKPTKAAPILNEMQARGWGAASSGGTRTAVYRELKWFTERGFLRYIKTPGKKEGDEWIVVEEAKKRLRVKEVS